MPATSAIEMTTADAVADRETARTPYIGPRIRPAARMRPVGKPCRSEDMAAAAVDEGAPLSGEGSIGPVSRRMAGICMSMPDALLSPALEG